MSFNIRVFISLFIAINTINARSHNALSYQIAKPKIETIKVDCHTTLTIEDFGIQYRLEASLLEGRICDLRVPSHAILVVETVFHDPNSYFRVVGTNGDREWTFGYSRVFSHNSTMPYHGHKRENTSVWITPCERSAILLKWEHPKDAIIFILKKLPIERQFDYKDNDKCFNV